MNEPLKLGGHYCLDCYKTRGGQTLCSHPECKNYPKKKTKKEIKEQKNELDFCVEVTRKMISKGFKCEHAKHLWDDYKKNKNKNN